MAVLADETGMNSEENDRKCESSHDSNLYFDRQLQNKLLQADEDSDTESYETKLSKSWNNLRSAKSSKYDSRIEDITGWFPSAKFVGRRNDNVVKTETKPTNTFIHPWKDYRSKKEETFVFKHYKEHKKYMEQYRNEHCYQTNRFSSGTPAGEMRRIAFQNSAPSQQSSTVAQNMHQSGHICSAPPSSTNNQSSLYYSNRTEQLGTLITPTTNCTCNNKQSANIGSSQSQRFKVVQGQFSRTNTNYDLRHLESDNSSDSGEPRHRAPSRRTNSASSTRSRTITAKSPTKISVPANPNARAYPVQALTIQQNGKAEVVQAPKPLDNLNCVAPEKQQPGGIEKRSCGEPLELALKIHSLNDLLTVNDNPLRGYALPKSMPPNPNHSNWNSSSSMDSDSDDTISLDRLSTCPLSADLKVRRSHDRASQHLKEFFKEDPLLCSLNKKPEFKPVTSERTSANTAAKDSFLIPQHDMNAILHMNMWNPILSTVPRVSRKEFSSQNYRNLMTQLPFRFLDEPSSAPKPIDNDLQRTVSEKVDLFNPSKKVRLSITRLNNGVSFCRTQVQNFKNDQVERNSSSMTRLSSGSAPSVLAGSMGLNNEPISAKLKPQIFDPFAEKLTKPKKFEQKFNMPVPHVKILESLPAERLSRANSRTMTSGQKTPNVLSENDSKNSSKKVSLSEHQVVNCGVEFNDDLFNGKKQGEEQTAEVEQSKQDHSADISNNTQEDEKQSNVNTNVMKGVQGVKINIDNRKSEKTEETEKANAAQSKVYKKPAVASGKCLKSQPELDGLTWAEKLQVLRSVNKREKPKPKQQKLKFMKGDPNDPVYLWSFEHDQLYEQRRIRHLVEQARIKGGKQFDWMYQYEAKKSRGSNWEPMTEEREETAPGSGESSEDEGTNEAGDKNLAKYGIYVPPNGVKQKLFNSHNINRSKTFIAP